MSAVRRADLDELSEDILVALANAGLVKRARRDVDADRYGSCELDGDGTWRARCDDGNVATLPPGSGAAGTCTCGATGTCRHLLGAVLAYQRSAPDGAVPGGEVPGDEAAAGEAVPGPDTSAPPLLEPPSIDDDALAAALAPRTLRAAQDARRRSYVCEISAPATDGDPWRVALATTTVSFLLGADLRYARCACTERTACPHVALAVWALAALPVPSLAAGATVLVEVAAPAAATSSAPDPSGPDQPDPDPSDPGARDTGGRDPNLGATAGPADTPEPGRPAEPGVAEADRAFDDVIVELCRHGLARGGEALALRLDTLERRYERLGWTWMALGIRRVGELRSAFDARSGRDAAAELVELLASLAARRRAASHGGELPPGSVLGSQERGESALGQLSLVGVGASVRAGDRPGTTRVDALLVERAGDLLCAPFTFSGRGPDTEPPDGPALARRRTGTGATVLALATGSAVTNGAVRRPDRVLTFRSGGMRRTSVVGGGMELARVGETGLVVEPAELIDRWKDRPPRLLRPPLAGEAVVAVVIERFVDACYDPARQAVATLVSTAAGGEVELVCEYRDLAPGAPAALARAVRLGAPAAAFGPARIDDGAVVVTPTLLVGPETVAPDLAPADDDARRELAGLRLGAGASGDPRQTLAAGALANASGALGDLLLEGADSGATRGVLREAGSALRRAGLERCATRFERLEGSAFAGTAGAHDGSGSADPLARAWADAAIAVCIGREQVAGGI
ncbi:MAG: hypothetical protein OEY23_13630 [Acidimicrobiia bacterium]|nr:hypothetical protein [Acidimicrobiia bacterium]